MVFECLCSTVVELALFTSSTIKLIWIWTYGNAYLKILGILISNTKTAVLCYDGAVIYAMKKLGIYM